jgi:hypothetical protein
MNWKIVASLLTRPEFIPGRVSNEARELTELAFNHTHLLPIYLSEKQ